MSRGRRSHWIVAGVLVLAPWLLRTALAEPEPSPAAVQENEAIPDDSASASETPPPEVPSPAGSASPAVDDMIHIGLGSTMFTMGSSDPKSPPNERPRHSEVVAPFWIDRTEVTVSAYRACVDSHACARPMPSGTSCTYDLPDAAERHLPVSCVHWRDADAFCRAVNKRLPREAEWEFAAKGKRGSRYPWGSNAGCFFAAMLVSDTSGRTCTKGPSPVGSHAYGVSPFGVMDLAGNVEEWTSDWYAENLSNGLPAAGASHVLRGGGWLSSPSMSRTTSRSWGSSMEAGPNVGFRCAKDG